MAKHLKPKFDDDDDDEDARFERYLQSNTQSESEDEFATLSFGSLKSAQKQLDAEEGRLNPKSKSRSKEKKPKKQVAQPAAPVSESESEGGLFEEEDESDNDAPRETSSKKNKKSKHAPTESSSKKKVSRIRQIPGLENPKQTSLYRDIRFDAAFGKADLNRVRKDYAFLDEYRQSEINEIDNVLKNKKLKAKLSDREVQDLEYNHKSLKSRLDTLKNKDLEQQVLKKYKDEHKGSGKFFLKNSEKKKIIQKHKFENMKASQREKVIERKRKRRLGKEFKQLEFNRPRN